MGVSKMSADKTHTHLEVWKKKPVLQAIYTDFYERILGSLKPGLTLEIGAGIGNLKQYCPDVIATDVVDAPWIDRVMDAQAMPFEDQSIQNIVGIDVLHHIERPVRFFKEALRVLVKGGRIILLDPAITPISYPFYTIHEEPVKMRENPLEDGELDPYRKPFDANQAIPTLLFNRYLSAFQDSFPQLELISKTYLSLWVYPLSGGFQSWCLIPQCLIRPLLRLEQKLESSMGKVLGFRIMVVLEKR